MRTHAHTHAHAHTHTHTRAYTCEQLCVPSIIYSVEHNLISWATLKTVVTLKYRKWLSATSGWIARLRACPRVKIHGPNNGPTENAYLWNYCTNFIDIELIWIGLILMHCHDFSNTGSQFSAEEWCSVNAWLKHCMLRVHRFRYRYNDGYFKWI